MSFISPYTQILGQHKYTTQVITSEEADQEDRDEAPPRLKSSAMLLGAKQRSFKGQAGFSNKVLNAFDLVNRYYYSPSLLLPSPSNPLSLTLSL